MLDCTVSLLCRWCHSDYYVDVVVTLNSDRLTGESGRCARCGDHNGKDFAGGLPIDTWAVMGEMLEGDPPDWHADALAQARRDLEATNTDHAVHAAACEADRWLWTHRGRLEVIAELLRPGTGLRHVMSNRAADARWDELTGDHHRTHDIVFRVRGRPGAAWVEVATINGEPAGGWFGLPAEPDYSPMWVSDPSRS